MKCYVYFDAYGHQRKVISEKELAEQYGDDPEVFLRAMGGAGPEAGAGEVLGSIGVVTLDREIGTEGAGDAAMEEITGFFECKADSRPYNF